VLPLCRRRSTKFFAGEDVKHPLEHQGPWSSGWPGRTQNAATAGSTGNWPTWECESWRRPGLIWNQNHLQRILRQDEIHHRPRRSLHGAALLTPLPEPVDLEQYRVRSHTRIGGLINEYRLVA